MNVFFRSYRAFLPQSRELPLSALSAQIPLDFGGTGSVCGDMDEKSRSAVSHKFAELTAVLEDATELAANGQSPTRGLSDLQEDVDQLWELFFEGIGLVSSIENLVRAER